MTVSRLYFGSNTADIIVLNNGLSLSLKQIKNQNRSSNGKVETINNYNFQNIQIDAVFTEANYRKLINWWSRARQGNVFRFALDSTKIGLAKLTGSADAGQDKINVIPISGFSVGDYCFIQAKDNDDEYEIVEIESISGSEITGADNLIYSYSMNDLFRQWRYWPGVISKNKEFNPLEIPGTGYYQYVFEFMETDIITPPAVWEDTDDVIWEDTDDVVWTDD